MPRSFAKSAVLFLLVSLAHLPRVSAQGSRFVVNPIYPVPLSPQLNAVRLLDARRAIAVGEHGAVLRTDDAGVTWARLESGTETPLHGLAVQGATAIAVGERGTMLRSADAGATWLRVAAPTDVELRAVSIAANGVAIAVGADGTVLSSRDGGASWTRIASPTTVMLRSVAFVRDSLVIAAGDGGVIIASNNGGSTWTPRRSGTSVQLRAVAFADAAHGVVVGGDDRRWRAQTEILVTADGGTTWSRVTSPAKSRLYGLAALDRSYVAVGEDGTLLRGENFGTAWKKDTTVSGGGAWLGAVSVASDVGFVVGAGGRILRSEHGSAWKPVTSGPKELGFPINSIARPSRNVLIVAGGAPGPKARPVIFRSTDGGATFTKAKADSAGSVIFVAFRDSLVGIAVGAAGTVLRSIDGGASWSRVEVDTKRNLRMLAFADSATAVLVGAFGRGTDRPAMLRTVDAGRTWTPVRSGSHGIIMGIAFRGKSLGFAVGAAGAILRSRDGGATWTKIEQGITNTLLKGVAILDEKTIVVAGDDVMLRSTDGGSRWAKVESGVEMPLMALRFSDDRFGIAVGFGDQAIFTEDGGQHWSPIPLGMHLFMNAVDIGNPILLGGRGGMARLDARSPAQGITTGTAPSRGGTPQ